MAVLAQYKMRIGGPPLPGPCLHTRALKVLLVQTALVGYRRGPGGPPPPGGVVCFLYFQMSIPQTVCWCDAGEGWGLFTVLGL